MYKEKEDSLLIGKEEMPEGNNTVLIPWTGGFDSTALVLKALSEGLRVHVPYVFLHNNLTGSGAELAARDRICRYLKDIGEWNGESPGVSAEVTDNMSGRGTEYAFPKWIVYSCLDIPEHVREVWVGYTLSDRTAENFNLDHHCNLIPAITSMVSLTHPGRSVEVKFPFYDTDKTKMLDYYMPLKYRKVFEMLSNCAHGFSHESGCRCAKCLKLETLRKILYSKII